MASIFTSGGIHTSTSFRQLGRFLEKTGELATSHVNQENVEYTPLCKSVLRPRLSLAVKAAQLRSARSAEPSRSLLKTSGDGTPVTVLHLRSHTLELLDFFSHVILHGAESNQAPSLPTPTSPQLSSLSRIRISSKMSSSSNRSVNKAGAAERLLHKVLQGNKQDLTWKEEVHEVSEAPRHVNWQVTAIVDGEAMGSGSAPKLRVAKARAAGQALINLGVIRNVAILLELITFPCFGEKEGGTDFSFVRRPRIPNLRMLRTIRRCGRWIALRLVELFFLGPDVDPGDNAQHMTTETIEVKGISKMKMSSPPILLPREDMYAYWRGAPSGISNGRDGDSPLMKNIRNSAFTRTDRRRRDEMDPSWGKARSEYTPIIVEQLGSYREVSGTDGRYAKDRGRPHENKGRDGPHEERGQVARDRTG
ncbi:hypothetical protein BS47DRAFT_1387528 [Hydnum rufescens UP504]|uniref:DRBM domain-containing protein n=1 Tax=Hydnum rufescens UP504 TaxID=1448309 RepID=A0A9P6BAC0_9AGAM|nr:hypothetical protein BS47DRAFT_1387528 [Hydnum rufescens UP504]